MTSSTYSSSFNVEDLFVLILGSPNDPDDLSDYLLFDVAMSGDNQRILSKALERVTDALLDAAWKDGWQPRDVRSFLPMKQQQLHGFAEFVIRHQARTYVDTAFVHPEWQRQLDDLPELANGSHFLERCCNQLKLKIEAVLPFAVSAITRMKRMPPIPRFLPPPGSEPTAVDLRGVAPSGDKTLDRIRALLAKAESTEFTE